MSINSRRKGAAFERHIAGLLFQELGITFKRNLNQYQTKNLDDLTPSDPDFPFVLEAKCYASGTDCKLGWMAQAREAATTCGKHPAVIWKFDRHPIRVRIDMDALAEALGTRAATHRTVDMDLPSFAYVAREIMARRDERTRIGAGVTT